MARPTLFRAPPVQLRESSHLRYDIAPAGSDANARPRLGLPPGFTEQVALEYRHELAEGLAYVQTTGFGRDRASSFWRSLEKPGDLRDQSLLFHDSRIELSLASGVIVRLSSRLTEHTDALGVSRHNWSSGAVLGLAPSTETSLYAGAFRSQNLDSGDGCNVFTAGVDGRLPGTPLTLSVGGWTAIGAVSAMEKGDFCTSGASGYLAWQASKSVTHSVGAEWDCNDSWAGTFACWRYFLATTLKTDANTSLSLQLSYLKNSNECADAALKSSLSETRVHLSGRRRLLENFDAEISLAWAMGSLVSEAQSGQASLRVAGQIAF